MLVNLTPVQNFIVGKATEILSDKLKTKVSVEHVRIDFLNHLLIQGLYIEDKRGDTLLYSGEARLRITDWFFLRKDKPVLTYVGLHDAYGNLYRTPESDEWNYQFIIDAFDTGKKDTTRKQSEPELDLEKVDLKNVRFHSKDAWAGSDFVIDVGNLQLNADEIDLKKRVIDVNSLEIDEAVVAIRDYESSKLRVVKKRVKTIDTTAFNPAMWVVKAKSVELSNSVFQLNSASRPAYAGEFDPSHIGVSEINFDVRDLNITGDTITGNLLHLSGKERSGLVIKKLSTKATVSPNATICDELYLETNNSKLHNYYAMHYERFPDFQDYVHKVVMVGRLNKSTVDSRDVAYFAPALKKYPTLVHISGNVAGTVDSLVGKNLNATDGSTSIKGDLSMIGLPDINTTFINFKGGELFTTNNAIFKYVPELRNNPSVAFEKISYVHYKGDFAGYIENFAASGTLASNLGNIRSDIKMRVPNLASKRAVYTGKITTDHFDLGTLLRQPLLGSIGVSAEVSGAAFDPDNAAVQFTAAINHFDVKGYRYKNITAEGTLEGKKFDGNLMVNDPNIAMAFYGSIDYNNKELTINATANLLQSNLQALNLTKDSILATADFDLNYVGDDIDEFSGYAKLYNINLIRNNHRLDVDSVYLNSTTEDGQKVLMLESNDIAARIKGNYQLSSLPYSIQYYISGYLPNYIEAPTKYAPDQNITFAVTTRQTDSILAVLAPSVKGFSNSTLSGVLNMTEQQLLLDANVPYGKVQNITLQNVNIKGNGNFRQLNLNADVADITLGDDVLSASMKVNTTLGNDSLSFDISTTSPDAVGNLSMQGNAVASGDSLYLSLLPSEFYLNKTKWEIPQGNEMVISKDYLYIRNLSLKSGLQEINAHTEDEHNSQALLVNIKDLDIAMLGNLAGIGDYQPEGRINGQVSMKNLFKGMEIAGVVKASNVKLANDTVGDVTLSGGYNAKKKIITLDPTSGIFRGVASIRTAGSMSFDSTNNQLLNGYIEFNEASLSWVSPFVQDFLSEMSGSLNGTINIGGSAAKPDISGNVTLNNAATKIDIIGTYYKIPSARLVVDNNSIDFGKVTIYDVHNNTATLTGGLAHDRFRNMSFSRVRITSPEFEVLNLKEYENNTFYGNLVANVESMTISGTFDDIRMSITAAPAARSHIFIPIKTTSDIGSYSYVSFKSYGQEQIITTKKRNKFSLNIMGKMNPLAMMTLVLDPATGDMINARGTGNIQLTVPSNDDIKMYGNYEIEEGDYTFTFRQLFFKRNFVINSGSRIAFNGPLDATNLNINAVYTARARLIDLLNEKEKEYVKNSDEGTDAKTAQDVNLLLHMSGSLDEPKLTFNIDLLESRSEGSLAYQKLRALNQNDRELFDQVASLLLIGTFMPQEGFTNTSAATSGAINNISEILSTTASSQLTNVVNKLLGDPDLAVELKYKNYNLSDQLAEGGINRNEISLGLRKNLLNDRLIVELGSAYDWGRPTSSNSSTSNLNLAGDFRVQYLLTEDGRIRLNAFHTNSYDVLVDRNIRREGVGISYRRTFDNLAEFFNRSKPEMPEIQVTPDTTRTRGTW